MYTPVTLQTDVPALTCRYVDQVEQPPFSVRLTRLGQRIRDTDPWIIDGFLGTAFVIVGVIAFYAGGGGNSHLRDPDVGGLLLTLAVAVPYYFRRHAPLIVLAVSVVPLVALVSFDYPTGTAPTILLVGLYTVAAYCTSRDRFIGAATMGAALAFVAVIGSPELNGAEMAFNVVIFAAAFLFGSAVRNRRLYTEQLEARAASLERERDEEAKRAVADERLRIAQDLHDVVAHSMGVIAVQAGVGAHVIDTDPAEAKRSLEAISHTSRSTLAEIRRMLGVLREDEGAAYAPAPGLADLERLVREICAAGVDTHVTWEGIRDEVPPGVDFTAYRIVQEALTNVMKHAGPEPHVDVTIGYEPQALRIEIVDDGRGVNGRATGGGHGLMGMRERVGVYGGTFEVGPANGGGFRVAVRLPYADSE
jgi:signal transduction histidine kinase